MLKVIRQLHLKIRKLIKSYVAKQYFQALLIVAVINVKSFSIEHKLFRNQIKYFDIPIPIVHEFYSMRNHNIMSFAYKHFHFTKVSVQYQLLVSIMCFHKQGVQLTQRLCRRKCILLSETEAATARWDDYTKPTTAEIKKLRHTFCWLHKGDLGLIHLRYLKTSPLISNEFVQRKRQILQFIKDKDYDLCC